MVCEHLFLASIFSTVDTNAARKSNRFIRIYFIYVINFLIFILRIFEVVFVASLPPEYSGGRLFISKGVRRTLILNLYLLNVNLFISFCFYTSILLYSFKDEGFINYFFNV